MSAWVRSDNYPKEENAFPWDPLAGEEVREFDRQYHGLFKSFLGAF